MRLWLTDTLATIFFFTIVATFTELILAGMSPREVLISRSLMIPMMVVTGRPYGAWRNGLFRQLAPRHRATRIAVDVAAFLSFQIPVYLATLVISGADLNEIITATGSATVFMMILSRPFGLFLDAVRLKAGSAPIAHSAG